MKIYIIIGTNEQISSLNKNIIEIKNILLRNQNKNIISVRTKIVNIYNDIEKLLQENKIKQHNEETGTFLNRVKSGKYPEINNQIFALLTLILLYLLVIVTEMATTGKLGSIFEHLKF